MAWRSSKRNKGEANNQGDNGCAWLARETNNVSVFNTNSYVMWRGMRFLCVSIYLVARHRYLLKQRIFALMALLIYAAVNNLMKIALNRITGR